MLYLLQVRKRTRTVMKETRSQRSPKTLNHNLQPKDSRPETPVDKRGHAWHTGTPATPEDTWNSWGRVETVWQDDVLFFSCLKQRRWCELISHMIQVCLTPCLHSGEKTKNKMSPFFFTPSISHQSVIDHASSNILTCPNTELMSAQSWSPCRWGQVRTGEGINLTATQTPTSLWCHHNIMLIYYCETHILLTCTCCYTHAVIQIQNVEQMKSIRCQWFH